jgi:hypothetical protein
LQNRNDWKEVTPEIFVVLQAPGNDTRSELLDSDSNKGGCGVFVDTSNWLFHVEVGPGGLVEKNNGVAKWIASTTTK